MNLSLLLKLLSFCIHLVRSLYFSILILSFIKCRFPDDAACSSIGLAYVVQTVLWESIFRFVNGVLLFIYNLMHNLISSGRSFIYIRNNNSPRFKPWGTLFVTLLQFGTSSLIMTVSCPLGTPFPNLVPFKLSKRFSHFNYQPFMINRIKCFLTVQQDAVYQAFSLMS